MIDVRASATASCVSWGGGHIFEERSAEIYEFDGFAGLCEIVLKLALVTIQNQLV